MKVDIASALVGAEHPGRARPRRTHAVVEGQLSAICGAIGPDGWQRGDAAEPTCRRCLRQLPQARERARALVPVEAPSPGAPLDLTCDWFRRLPTAFGRPDFPGFKIRLSGEHTFADLARLTWLTLGMGGVRLADTYAPDDTGGVELEDGPWRFALPDGRVVLDAPDDVERPRDLVTPPGSPVSATLGRGAHLDFSWGRAAAYRAMLRVDR